MSTTRCPYTTKVTGVRRVAAASLLVCLVGCGSPGGPSPEPNDPDPATGQKTQREETNESEEKEASEEEASVTTTLDLGQPFAEDPSADPALEGFDVAITSTRQDLSAIPVTIRLTNQTAQRRQVLALDVQANWLPSTSDPLEPDPARTLVASIEAQTGVCSTVSSTAEAYAGTCTLGLLEPQHQWIISLIVTSTYNLQIGLHMRSVTE